MQLGEWVPRDGGTAFHAQSGEILQRSCKLSLSHARDRSLYQLRRKVPAKGSAHSQASQKGCRGCENLRSRNKQGAK